MENIILKDDLNLVVANNSISLLLPIITDTLNEFGIKQNKKIFMYLVEEERNYYIGKLVSLISGIDFRTIDNYCNTCNPWINSNKKVLEVTEHKRYIEAMDKVISSNLLITDKNYTNDDVIDYILLDEEENIERSAIIIIDNLKKLLTFTKYTKEEVILKFKNYSKKYKTKFLLFSVNNDLDESLIDNIINIENI